MINRLNYEQFTAYLEFLRDVMQLNAGSVRRNSCWLKHLLRWADERALIQAHKIRPVFPQYLANTRDRNTGNQLSKGGVGRACQTARAFFRWAKKHFPRDYRRISAAWVQTLQPPRMSDEAPKQREVVVLEKVRQLVAVPDNDNLRVRRDQAAAAFLFLSGMRGTAFCTMPIKCLEVAERTVMQYPSMGVKTKNRKAAITHLLNIPDLLEVIESWDDFVSAELPSSALWYPPIQGSFGNLRFMNAKPGRYRGETLRTNIRRLFQLAQLEPMSPHKFRHGHAVYGLQQAVSMADYKAVSQNLMHANLGITDSIYAMLSDADVSSRIANLGNGVDSNQRPDHLGLTDNELATLRKVLAKL